MAGPSAPIAPCDTSPPMTPAHTPHSSINNTPSRTKTPLQTLSLHEYRKQQRSPVHEFGNVPKGLKRRPATPHLNPGRLLTSLSANNVARSALAPLPHLQNRSLTAPPVEAENRELRPKVTVIDLRNASRTQEPSFSAANTKAVRNPVSTSGPLEGTHLRTDASAQALRRRQSATELRSAAQDSASTTSPSIASQANHFSSSDEVARTDLPTDTSVERAQRHVIPETDEWKGSHPIIGALHVLARPNKVSRHSRDSTGESLTRLIAKGSQSHVPANAFIFTQPFGYPERPSDLHTDTPSLSPRHSNHLLDHRAELDTRNSSNFDQAATVADTQSAYPSDELNAEQAVSQAIGEVGAPVIAFDYSDFDQASLRTPRRHRSPHASVLLSAFTSPAKSDVSSNIAPITTVSKADQPEDIAEDPFTDLAFSETKFEPKLPPLEPASIKSKAEDHGHVEADRVSNELVVSRLTQYSSNSSLPRLSRSFPPPPRNPTRLQRSPLAFDPDDNSGQILYAHEEPYFSISSFLDSSSRKSSFQKSALTSHSRFDSAQTGTAQEDLDSFYQLYRHSSGRTSTSFHSRKRLPRPDGSRTETSSVSSKSQVQVHHHGTSFDLVNPHRSLDLAEVEDESDGDGAMRLKRRLTDEQREDKERRDKLARDKEKANLKQQTNHGLREVGFLRPLSQMLHLSSFPTPTKTPEPVNPSPSPLLKATSSERFEAFKFKFPPSDDPSLPSSAYGTDDEKKYSQDASSIINHYAHSSFAPSALPDPLEIRHLNVSTPDLPRSPSKPDLLALPGGHITIAAPEKAHIRPKPLKTTSAFVDRTLAAAAMEENLGWHRYSLTPRLRTAREGMNEKEWAAERKKRIWLWVGLALLVLAIIVGVAVGVAVGVMRK